MNQLFKVNTVRQRKIMEWLVAQGITGTDIQSAELSGPGMVRVTNPAGQYMDVYCAADNAVRILQVTAEREDELQKNFWSENYEPETQEWRENLTADEAAMVEEWDSAYESCIPKLVSDNYRAAEVKEEYLRLSKRRLHAEYPWTRPEQLDEIAAGGREGLTQEQIAVYAKPEFSWLQMNAIRHVYSRGLTQEQIDLLAKPQFGSVEMDILCSAFQSGLSVEQVKTFAKPGISALEMLDARRAIQEGRSWEPKTQEWREELTAEEFSTEQAKWMLDACRETVYGYDLQTWHNMSESKQITIQDKYEYALQHPDEAEWGLDY